MTTYTMEAKENYSAELLVIVATNPGANAAGSIFTSQVFVGDCYDPIRRQIIYSACTELDDPVLLDYTVWDGSADIPSGDDVNTFFNKNFTTLVRDIAAGTVTGYDAHDPALLVPAGIGGGDGTWARAMDTYSYSQRQVRRLVNPRNGNLWQHTYGEHFECGLYLLRFETDYAQEISPVNYVSHMEIAGLTADWLYVLREPAAHNNWFEKIQLIPADITADEVTADELLVYAEFDLPAVMKSPGLFRWTLDLDGNMWFFGCNKSGARQYFLYKFEPPTSAPYGGPTVGGSVTDMTPWTSSTGPNDTVSDYDVEGVYGLSGTWNKNIMFAAPTPDSEALDMLVLISKLFPGDHTFDSRDPLLMRWDCTYYDIAAEDYETHASFVTGYMKADWTTTADIAEAAYSVIDCQEVDAYLNFHSFNFEAENGATALASRYGKRTFFFTVQKVIEGAWTYDAAENHTVIVQYEFTQGSAPIVTAVYDEDLWYAAYSYTGLAHPMNTCMKALGQSTTGLPQFYEWGAFDAPSASWYWSGRQSINGMELLDPTYADRGYNAGLDLDSSFPFLRIAIGVPPRRVSVSSYVGGPM